MIKGLMKARTRATVAANRVALTALLIAAQPLDEDRRPPVV
jgi:hypothetical protein